MGNCFGPAEPTPPVGSGVRKIVTPSEVSANKPTGQGNAQNHQGNPDYTFKILMQGETGVGKTSLVLQFVQNSLIQKEPLDMADKIIIVNGKTVKLNIWDQPTGQQGAIATSPYRDTAGVVIVFDVCSRVSFLGVPKWAAVIEQYTSEKTVVILAGNKCDSAAERVVTEEEIQNIADNLGVAYVETSALTPTNVDKVFAQLATAILDGELKRNEEINKQKS